MRGSRKRLVLAAGAAALALGGAGAAQAAQARSYAIPPGTTAEALNAYARQSGRQLVFPYDAAASTRSAGVQGAVADDAALGQVLKGSRLTLASSDGKVVTLRAAAFRPATAQPAEPTPAAGPTAAAVSAPEPTVSEVVVTANKRAERAIDVANSVTAVSEEALERRNLTRIEEFAAQVPGLSIRSGLNGGTLLILRGLNTGGTGATVAATVDDAPLSYTSANGGGSIDTANIDTFDLERIEVLRGPQGTLYGSAAEGGLLKYVINKPKYDRFEGKLEVGGEGIDGGGVGGSVRGVVNVPLIDGRLALRASGFYYDTPGYIRNPLLGRSDLGEGERYGGRVALAFKASDTLSFRVTVLRQKQTNDAQGAVEALGSHASPAAPPANFLDIANGGVLTRNSRIVENSAREFNLYDGHIDWALPWLDVTSVTSYGEIETSYVLDNSNFALGGPATVASLFGARYGQPIVAQGQPNFSLHKFNQEVRFSSKPKSTVLGLPVELQAGFYYTKEDVNLASISNALSAANTSVVLTTPSPLGASLLTATYEE